MHKWALPVLLMVAGLTAGLGVSRVQPLTLIAEAVFARCLSALKDERVAASLLVGAALARKVHYLATAALAPFAG